MGSLAQIKRLAPINELAPIKAFALVAVIALSGCQEQPTTAVTLQTAVTTTLATSGPARAAISMRGAVAFRDETRLSFKVGGVIRQIRVDAGSSVQPGQLLADIEPAEIDSQLEQARQLDDKAARDLERGERLRADEVISVEQLQNLKTQREMAAAQLSAANYNRGRASIVAPGKGTVLRRLAETHEQVQAGQPILVVGSAVRGFVVRAAVSDRELVQLRRGDKVNVTLDAAPGSALRGTVSALTLAADTGTGLFPIEVELAPASMTLASGMVATISIAPASNGVQLVRVPASAIVAAQGDEASVFVIEAAKAHKRTVRIAFLDGTQAALQASSAIKAGDAVVSAGAPYIDDGETVTVSAQ